MSAETEADQINGIFFPNTHRKTKAVLAAGGRFAYYTTADTATRIFNSQEIWLRNTLTMNDFMEIEHGVECLKIAYNGEPGKRFNAAIDDCYPGLSKEVAGQFDAWLPNIRRDTYITCLSEHSATEDRHGRLSMWRAYGGQTGVALVINGAVMFSESDVLGAYSSPVAYSDSDGVSLELFEIAKNIAQATEYVKSLGREKVKNILFNMFRFSVLCTKHPGFHEEREWRIVASPSMYPSNRLMSTIEVIHGIPQTVLKIHLHNEVEQGLTGLAIPELLDRVIIGPCESPQVIRSAFQCLLNQAGVQGPEKKVIVSDIPLRHPA